MKKKIILSIIVLFLMVTGGTLYYLLQVKEYDTADENVEQIVTSDYEIVLPDENTQISNEEVSTDQGEKKLTILDGTADHTETSTLEVERMNNSTKEVENANNSSQPQTQQTSSSQNGTTINVEEKKNQSNKTNENNSNSNKNKNEDGNIEPLAASITSKYEPTFLALEDQANQKIDSLVSFAINEYKLKKANGEDVSYFYFYSKYSRAGNVLEDKTDEAFQVVYNTLVNELASNGFDESYATPYRDHYESTKASRRNALVSKAMDRLK